VILFPLESLPAHPVDGEQYPGCEPPPVCALAAPAPNTPVVAKHKADTAIKRFPIKMFPPLILVPGLKIGNPDACPNGWFRQLIRKVGKERKMRIL
jgi:hypothetical protein